jgi:hypothetical protein
MKPIIQVTLCALLAGCAWDHGPASQHLQKHASLKDEPVKVVKHLPRPSGPGEIRMHGNRAVTIDQQTETEELHREWWESDDDDF